jgi:hypothetical protein
LGGQITLPRNIASVFPKIDNGTFTCALAPDLSAILERLPKLDHEPVAAAMVSNGRAFSMGETLGYPMEAMIEAADGKTRVLMPGTITFKVAVKAGMALHAEGFDIESKRAITAGESIRILYIDGSAILSIEGNGAPLSPVVSVFLSTSKNREATVGAWRIEKQYNQ